jgi:hypothetical protein
MNNTTISWLTVAMMSVLLSGCGEDGPTTRSVGLDNGSNGGGNGGGGTTTRNGGRLQFSVSSLDVAEGAGTATLSITRTDGTDGAATVTVTSRDGTATAPADYTALTTTVSFAAGDSTAKTVTIPIVDDATDEPDETLYVKLSGVSGAALGSGIEVLVTINDDDLSAPAAPKAAMSAAYRKLHVDWTPVDGATSYRLMKDATGGGTFTQVGTDLAATEKSVDIDVVLHREDWLNSHYAIAACNSAGCTQSASVGIDGLSVALIGYLKASNPTTYADFGYSVAISADGNVLAVGAPYEGSAAIGVGGNAVSDCDAAAPANCSYSSGAVYVYTRSTSGWSVPVYIKADHIGTSNEGDSFGSSLALNSDGTMLAVGAPYEDSSNVGINGTADELAIYSGAVYLYTRDGTAWTSAAFVKPPTSSAYSNFGTSVALSADGNTLAVASPYESSAATGIGGNPVYDCSFGSAVNCANSSGAVYVFARTGGAWSPAPTYIKAPRSIEYLYFGAAIALSADGATLVAGASGEDGAAVGINGSQVYDCAAAPAVNCLYGSGAAYIYSRSGSTWNAAPVYVKPTNTRQDMFFGTAVAISGDGNTVAIGAPSEQTGSGGIDPTSECFTSGTNCVSSAGAVYTYQRNGATWSTGHFIKAPQPDLNDNFGNSLALNADGTSLAVAVPYEDGSTAGVDGVEDNLSEGSGAVFFYERSGPTWAAPRYIKAANPERGDSFGSSVALSGDALVLAVGAIYEDSAATGFNGNQIDDCGASAETNCAVDAGGVYLYQ